MTGHCGFQPWKTSILVLQKGCHDTQGFSAHFPTFGHGVYMSPSCQNGVPEPRPAYCGTSMTILRWSHDQIKATLQHLNSNIIALGFHIYHLGVNSALLKLPAHLLRTRVKSSLSTCFFFCLDQVVVLRDGALRPLLGGICEEALASWSSLWVDNKTIDCHTKLFCRFAGWDHLAYGHIGVRVVGSEHLAVYGRFACCLANRLHRQQ